MWAPATGIQGMAASALVATQDAPALGAASPEVAPNAPVPSTTATAPSRSPLSNDPPAADVVPVGCRCGIATRSGMGEGALLSLVGTLAIVALRGRSRRRC